MQFNLLLFTIINIINYTYCFNVISINLLIKKSLEDSLISFIKLPYIHNLKIKNHTNYLILNYLDDPKKKTVEKLDVKLRTNIIQIKDDNNQVVNIIDNDRNPFIQGVEVVEEDQNNSFYNVYDIIKNNKKPLIIINKKNRNNINHKYLYMIKSKNEYLMRYSFDYNNRQYKYYFDILANSIDNYETSWEISAFIKDYSVNKALTLIGLYVKNWIEHNIYNNLDTNGFYKRYLVLYYFLNN